MRFAGPLQIIPFLALVCSVVWTSHAQAQRYSSTPFRAYSNNEKQFDNSQWATSSPEKADKLSEQGATDFDSMSPDSWSIPSNGSEYVDASKTSPNEGSPTIGAYQSAGFARPTSTLQSDNQFQLPTSQAKTKPKANGQPGAVTDKSVLRMDQALPKTVFSLDTPTGPSTNGRYPLEALEGEYYAPANPGASAMQNAPTAPNLETVSSVQIQHPLPPGTIPVTQEIPTPSLGAPQTALPSPSVKFVPQNPTPVLSTAPGSPLTQPQTSSWNAPRFRPDLGHRDQSSTLRNLGSWDGGQKYDFEDKKKEYPPMKEILATGRYFGSVGILVVEPHFQSNTAIAISGPSHGDSQLFEFDDEAGPQIRLGFESKYGPGIELNYWQVDGTSDMATFTSDGTLRGETSTWMMGPNSWSRLIADDAGETLNATHEIDVESFSISFFKEMKFPISRINGRFGFQYLKVAQALDANLVSGGVTTETLTSMTEMEAYGPNLTFEYYRPVGHTKLEFITSAGLAVLFGDRNQAVSNSATGVVSQIQANEFITSFDFFTGGQYKKNIAENRSLYSRLGFSYSTWLGGGTANNPNGDFGLRGFLFTVGYNR